MRKRPIEIEERIDKLLRDNCSSAADGLWRRLRFVMEYHSQRPGFLLTANGQPVTQRQISRLAGCNSERAAHRLQELQDAGLIARDKRGGPFYAPLLVSLVHIRQSGRKRIERHRNRRAHQPQLPFSKGGYVTTNVTPGVTPGVTTHVTPGGPSPPASSLPPDPSLLLHPSQPSGACAPAADASHPAGARRSKADKGENGTAGPKKTAREPKPRKLSDEQLATRDAFQTWWINDAWPAVHMGVQYPDFDGGDAKAVLKLLRTPHVHWDLQTAKDVAQVYLRQPECYGAVGHKLREIGNRLGHYLDLYERAKKGWLKNGKRKPTAADRGEYHRALPSGVRSLDDVELPVDAHSAASAD